MHIRPQGQGGFIKLVIILIIVLIVLGYFGFNIQQIIQSPSVSNNLGYAWGLAVTVWNKVLVVPATFVWNKIVIGMFWNTLVSLIDKAQTVAPAGQPTLPTFQN